MLEFLVDLVENRQLLVMMFAGIAAAATVLTLAMPLLATDQLEKRMAAERTGANPPTRARTNGAR